ncbi:MAG: hypothetical protein PHP01_03275 [Phycisphaerae bacterium]|nr:hypothetical protein [Phycisphaerae bacterium]
MNKKCVCLMFVLLMLGIVGTVSAADRNWTNGSGTRAWGTSGNWDTGIPTSADKAAIRNSAILGPIIATGTNAVAAQVVIGDWSSANDTLDMTGGTLTTSSWVTLGYSTGNNGTFTISGGTVNFGSTLYVGLSGTGTINMTGGTITVASTLGIAQNAGSTGTANLNGGSISCGSFNMTGGGSMDITTGTLIISGDVTTAINGYVTGGQITAYAGTGTVNVDYNTSNPGKTTVTASPPASSTQDWTNGNGDRLWRVAANWSGNAVPIGSDKAAIRNDTILGPIIDSSTTAVANQVVLGDWSSTSDTLDITGGTLTTNSWMVLGYSAGNNGIFTVTGGNATVGENLIVGNSGAGTVDITGGSITVVGTFAVAQLAGSTGTVLLDGGTINCAAFTMATGSLMDVTAGTLIVDGDYTTTINTYLGNGWITAYGGSGSLNVSFNVPNAGKTTVTATMPTNPPTKASNPNPPNSATGVAILPTLTWTAGTGASSRDVYFGTSNPPAFRQNQTAVTFSPGVLQNNTLYYWRIDEKNVQGTATGDVWSFTTVNDTSYSLIGKIMCGYQGWFNCPGDGTSRGWVHWSQSTSSFTPANCKIDLWPDMTEYGATEKFLASSFYDGTDRYVFSSHNRDTVLRHFQWMQTYGIDGVYLQRFASECTPGSASFNHRNDVLSYVKDGANLYGRKYAIMYDLNGLVAGGTQKVIDDWKWLIDTGRISRTPGYDPAYIWHENKPVVAVYGIGYSGKLYTHQEVRNLIDWLKNDSTYGQNTVLIGCYQNWRTVSDTYVQQTLQLADIIMPWLVGAYTNTSGVNNWASTKGAPDKSWCDTNGKEYLPVMFPGFSWHNMYDTYPLNQIPRNGGQFLWDQVYADIHTVGAAMLYIAMFDEVDEGTAIFKFTNDPPKPGGATLFVTPDFDGYPLGSDEYLWLAGQATRGLRNEIPVNQTRPTRTASAETNWTNGNGNRAWNTAANWDNGIPGSGDKAGIRNDAVSGPIISAGTNAVANQVVVGDLSSTGDTIDMTGGTLTTGSWMILGYGATNSGTFTVSGGTVSVGSDLFAGFGGTGAVNITGGSITVTGTFGIAQNTGSTGDVFLDGGTISCGTFNMTNGGLLDIEAGILIVNGDVTSTVNGYISSGWITAYGGAGTVNVSYNTPNASKTTITATAAYPPAKATNPTPANSATNVGITTDLSWTAGSGATSHDVYFGTDSTPDSGEFMGNQAGTTFDTGTMANNTTYYWRIDEKNAAGTTTGDVWSFTTAAATGVDRNWTNGGGTRAWNTAGNWDTGVPNSLDKAAIRNSAISGPIIAAGTNAVANQVVIGDWSSTSDTLDMTGGTLTTGSWVTLGYGATNSGTFTISAGTVNIGTTLYAGLSGTGTINMTGGTITVAGAFGIAQQTGSTGNVSLDGGTISCGSLNMTSGGLLDIEAGTLIVNGDVTSTINGYVSGGQITGYGGAGTVNVSYNTPNAGKTTVTATAPSSSWTELAFDDFESGFGHYTDGGGDCSLYTGGIYANGSNAADIQDNSGTSSSFYLTNGINVAGPGYTQIKVEFRYQPVGMESGEDFWLQYYDGSIWHTVATWVSGADFQNNQVYNPTVYIDEAGYTFPTAMKIRFMCDASSNTDDVYIDDVRISAQ